MDYKRQDPPCWQVADRRKKWGQLFATARYVDDTCMISKSHCRQCLQQCIDEMSPIPFDATKEEDNVPWLDLQLTKNNETIIVHTNFKPMTTAPAWACDQMELRSRIMGMVARLQQCKAPLDDVIKEVINMLTALQECGWDKSIWRGMFYKFGEINSAQHYWFKTLLHYIQ